MKVGDKVYIEPYGTNAIRSYGKTMQYDEIASIGRKYITTLRHGRYDINTLIHDGGQYLPDWRMWLSLSDYELHKETLELKNKLPQIIPTLSLEHLRYINNYINTIN